MWSFFSRDSTKDFPYEIIENVAGKVAFSLKINSLDIFPIFLSFSAELFDSRLAICRNPFQVSKRRAFGASRKANEKDPMSRCRFLPTRSRADPRLSSSWPRRVSRGLRRCDIRRCCNTSTASRTTKWYTWQPSMWIHWASTWTRFHPTVGETCIWPGRCFRSRWVIRHHRQSIEMNFSKNFPNCAWFSINWKHPKCSSHKSVQ